MGRSLRGEAEKKLGFGKSKVELAVLEAKRARHLEKKLTAMAASKIEENHGYNDERKMGNCGICLQQQPDVYQFYVEQEPGTPGARIRSLGNGGRIDFDGAVMGACPGCLDMLVRAGRRFAPVRE